MRNVLWKEKGQGENHPVPVQNNPLLKDNKNIALLLGCVKSGKHKSSLPCFYAFHKYAPDGIQTRIQSLAGNCLIQLDDRGDFSFDTRANIFDNLSNYDHCVKWFK